MPSKKKKFPFRNDEIYEKNSGIKKEKGKIPFSLKFQEKSII